VASSSSWLPLDLQVGEEVVSANKSISSYIFFTLVVSCHYYLGTTLHFYTIGFERLVTSRSSFKPLAGPMFNIPLRLQASIQSDNILARIHPLHLMAYPVILQQHMAMRYGACNGRCPLLVTTEQLSSCKNGRVSSDRSYSNRPRR
jgi:hypothetical protein